MKEKQKIYRDNSRLLETEKLKKHIFFTNKKYEYAKTLKTCMKYKKTLRKTCKNNLIKKF